LRSGGLGGAQRGDSPRRRGPWREMLVTSRDRIQKLFNEGKSEQEVVAAKPLADLDAKWAANEQQAQNWTRMVYNSFKRS